MNAFMNVKSLRTMTKALQILNNLRHDAVVGTPPNKAICVHLGLHIDNRGFDHVKMVFSHWKHYSGNPAFPVPCPRTPRGPKAAADAYRLQSLWAPNAEAYKHPRYAYARKRLELLDWLIKEAIQRITDLQA